VCVSVVKSPSRLVAFLRTQCSTRQRGSRVALRTPECSVKENKGCNKWGELCIEGKCFLGDGDGERCDIAESTASTCRSPVILLADVRKEEHTALIRTLHKHHL
jgi:hypothetical protein